MRTRDALLGIVLAVGCTQPAPAITVPTEDTSSPSQYVLRADAALVIPVAKIAGQAETLQLAITRISNPDITPFAIEVALLLASDAGAHTVGTLSPYPPDRAGTFTLPLGADQASALRTGPGQLQLRIEAIHDQAPLARLQVELSEPRWVRTR